MNQGQPAIHRLTKIYSQLLLVIFALTPSAAAVYLYLFQRPPLFFENHTFHVISIAVSILAGAFVSHVTWRCYCSSGEPFLRWLTLAFLGFTLVYAPHGIFTAYSHHHLSLFLLYGPVSRMIMGACLLRALFVYGWPAEDGDRRTGKAYWQRSIGVFLLVDLAVAVFVTSSAAASPAVRSSMEIGALCLSLTGLVILVTRHIRSPLMTTFYGLSLACFAQSSLAFVFAHAWNHLWWLAHGIFAAGFLLLSYGVVRAFLTTRSFASVYSQDELLERAMRAKAEAQRALGGLQEAHVALAHKAEELSRFNLLLDRAKRELEQRNAELDAFASSIAHELRAPIFAVNGFAQILTDEFGAQLPPLARKHLADIRQSTRKMDLMVKNLLNLARLHHQQLRLEATPLNAVVESVLRDVKAEFTGRDIE